ncbi:hypothetical protein E4U54_007486 [Claviceps lovelessii]|nr:hypothetical protein E4U54_007486 [Claviceps lovelessii]
MTPWIPGQEEEPLESCRSVGIVDNTLDDAKLESACPLDDGRHALKATCSAGLLDLLPLELIAPILLVLDLPSLSAFRQVNRRAMDLVDSLHQYAMVRRHCPNVLRAILSIGAASYDCITLYETLCVSKCASCDRTGPYIYLITCKRVCYFCFTSSAAYLPANIWEATRKNKIRKERLRLLPRVCSLPGRYGHDGRISRKRIQLFDRQAMVKLAEQSSGMAVPRPQPDSATTRYRRYMSIISAPYFDPSGRSADWGVYCMGCCDDTEDERHFRNNFTKDGLVEHIARYGKVTLNERQTRVIHSGDLDTN